MRKLMITIALLLIGFSAFYYVVVYLPRRDDAIKQVLASCLANVVKLTPAQKGVLCQRIGKEANCDLPEDQKKELDAWREQAIGYCYQFSDKLP